MNAKTIARHTTTTTTPATTPVVVTDTTPATTPTKAKFVSAEEEAIHWKTTKGKAQTAHGQLAVAYVPRSVQVEAFSEKDLRQLQNGRYTAVVRAIEALLTKKHTLKMSQSRDGLSVLSIFADVREYGHQVTKPEWEDVIKTILPLFKTEKQRKFHAFAALMEEWKCWHDNP